MSSAILENVDQIVKRGLTVRVLARSSTKIALGHRRLAIVDLSSAGYQPMTSGSNRYVMTYNGEIYNTDEIKNKLIKSRVTVNWRGHSDAGTSGWF